MTPPGRSVGGLAETAAINLAKCARRVNDRLTWPIVFLILAVGALIGAGPTLRIVGNDAAGYGLPSRPLLAFSSCGSGSSGSLGVRGRESR